MASSAVNLQDAKVAIDIGRNFDNRIAHVARTSFELSWQTEGNKEVVGR